MSRLMRKVEAARKKAVELTPEQQKFFDDNKQYVNEQWKKISPYMYLAIAYNKELQELGEVNDYGKSKFSGKDAYDKVGKYFVEFINRAKAINMPKEQFNYPSAAFINKIRSFQTKTKSGSASDFLFWLYDSIQKAEGDGVLSLTPKYASINKAMLKKEVEADIFLQKHLRTNIRRLAQRIA